GKYIQKTGDKTILKEQIAGLTGMTRIENMIEYLLKNRYNQEYSLSWGAMTADWGDVQPDDDFGCDWNNLSNEAIDVYDNAMLIIALDYLIDFAEDNTKVEEWKTLKETIATNTRKHLWDAEKQKFIPHLYPSESPLPKDFDENK